MDKTSDHGQAQRVARRLVPTDGDRLPPEELKTLTPEIIAQRTKALKPLIASRAHEAELLGHPVEEVWNAIRRTGLYYLPSLKKYGGFEANFEQLMDAIMPICEADPATGWLVAFTCGTRATSMFSEKLQDELFGGGRFLVMTSLVKPAGKAVKVDGGWRVNGHWSWGTTVQVATLVSGICTYETENGPKDGTFLMRAEEVTILDTWNADGLIATGTHQVVAKDVFVPDDRFSPSTVVSPEWHDTARKLYTYPNYLTPVLPGLSIAVGIAVVGNAKGAVDLYREHLLVHSKARSGYGEADRMSSQVRLAKAASLAQAAELLLRAAARQIFDQVDKSREEYEAPCSEARAWVAQAGAFAREAIGVMCESTGTGMHDRNHPLQRHLRDIWVGTSHGAIDYDVCMEQHGRGALGMRSNTLK